jgi:hypothetical protein
MKLGKRFDATIKVTLCTIEPDSANECRTGSALVLINEKPVGALLLADHHELSRLLTTRADALARVILHEAGGALRPAPCPDSPENAPIDELLQQPEAGVHPGVLWNLLGLPRDTWHDLMQDNLPAATAEQLRMLEENYKVTPIPELTSQAAFMLLAQLRARSLEGLATPRQLYFLHETGVGDAQTTCVEAKALLEKAWGKA